MNHYRLRLDGRIVNLKIGESLSIPSDFSPPRSWFYKLANKWRKRMPDFKIMTSFPQGSEYMIVSRLS